MRAWWLLAGAVTAEVCASLSLKGAIGRPGLYAVVVVGYLASFVCLTLCLRRGMPLGVAYGVWGALGVTLTAAASALLFAEPITAVMGIGIALVIAGVLMVELGAQRAHADRSRQRGSA